MPHSFDSGCNKADVCGHTGGKLGTCLCHLASLVQVAGHRFSLFLGFIVFLQHPSTNEKFSQMCCSCSWFSCLTLCHCRTQKRAWAFTPLLFFVFSLLSSPASVPLLPSLYHNPVMFSHAWLKVTSPLEAFMAKDVVSHLLRARWLSMGVGSSAAGLSPCRAVGVWRSGSAGVLMWQKRSMVTMKCLLKRQILGGKPGAGSSRLS